MKTCEVRLYNSRSLFYTSHPTSGVKSGEFSALQRLIGEHLETPELLPLDVENEVGYIHGTVKDLSKEPVPYKVRVWVLAEYEPEKL